MSAVESSRVPAMTVAVTCLAAVFAGCSEAPDDALPGEHPVVSLEPAASSSAPMSYNDDIALVTEDIACIVNSYEYRVRCADRDGSAVGVFGREGEGPGEHRDDTTATVVASPAYVEELPSQRDVDEYTEGLARLAGTMAQAAGGLPVARSAMEPYAAGYREDPKMWFLSGIPFKFDSEGRLWVATSRDRDAYSYLDIWIGTEYVGTVRIRDRLMGYDLFGSTFAALIAGAPGPDGIAERAIDWYDIPELRWPGG